MSPLYRFSMMLFSNIRQSRSWQPMVTCIMKGKNLRYNLSCAVIYHQVYELEAISFYSEHCANIFFKKIDFFRRMQLLNILKELCFFFNNLIILLHTSWEFLVLEEKALFVYTLPANLMFFPEFCFRAAGPLFLHMEAKPMGNRTA